VPTAPAIELVSAASAGRRWRNCKQTTAMDEATRSAWRRKQGLYPAELEAWKQDAIACLGEPRAASAVEAPQDRRRVRELERELHRKDKALAETAALSVLSKNCRRSSTSSDGRLSTAGRSPIGTSPRMR